MPAQYTWIYKGICVIYTIYKTRYSLDSWGNLPLFHLPAIMFVRVNGMFVMYVTDFSLYVAGGGLKLQHVKYRVCK